MRMLHIHNPMHNVHIPHWEEIRPRMKQLLISPIFWAIVTIAAFIALLIMLAISGPKNQWYEFPNYPYGGYPFIR